MSQERVCRLSEVAYMYPAYLIGTRAVASHDGNTHAPLISLADRSSSDHLGYQTLGAFLGPFHAVISVANSSEGLAD